MTQNITSLLIMAGIFLTLKTSGQDNAFLTSPDSTFTYSYLENGDSVPLSKTLKVNISDTTSFVEMVYNEGSWQNNLKTDFYILFESFYEVNYTWTDSAWIPASYTLKEYNRGLLNIFSCYNFNQEQNEWNIEKEIRYYYNAHSACDSVYYFTLNTSTDSLELTKKEYYSNSYDLPIQMVSYVLNKKGDWEIEGKIEFQYNENGYDITEIHYEYRNEFILNSKILTNKDYDNNIVFREVLEWRNQAREWIQVSCFMDETKDEYTKEKTTLVYKGKSWRNETLKVIYFDEYSNISFVEDLTWNDAQSKWQLNHKTFYKKLTVSTFTKNVETMMDKAYISDHEIIIDNEGASNSNYALYSLNGTLLQKGVVNSNAIQLNPQISNQTLILIIKTNINTFSQKLNYIR